MLKHRALGRDLNQLTVFVIDNRASMLAIMRAMLASIGARRIETHVRPQEALRAMEKCTPDIVIAAASMAPTSGPRLVRAMRRADAGALSTVPAMIMSSGVDAGLTAMARKVGAHQVLPLPLSASTLYRRLDWLVNDPRPFELKGDHYVVSGLESPGALCAPPPVCASGSSSLGDQPIQRQAFSG